MTREYIVKVTDALVSDAFQRFENEWAPEQELIRCKDCIHYRYHGLTEDTVSECEIGLCENQGKDWFCAEGERM